MEKPLSPAQKPELFETWQLHDLVWQPVENQTTITKTSAQAVTIKGIPFILEGREEDRSNKDSDNAINLKRIFSIHRPGTTNIHPLLFGSIELTGNKNHPPLKAKTLILKPVDDPDLKGGIGLSLWKKMTDLIEIDAQQQGVAIQHCIEMAPEISQQKPLTEKRWLELFLPFLDKRGYTQAPSTNGVLTWTKTYQP